MKLCAQGFVVGLVLYSSYLSAEQTYILARAPQFSSVTMSRLWTPFVKYLSHTTGYKFRLKLYHDRTDFEADLKQGRPDLFYANPGYFAVMHRKYAYVPLVRSNARQLKGIIVARKNSGIDSIQQLNGKTISFPGKNAFAASLYIRSILKNKLKINIKTKYIAGHDNVYRSVVSGRSLAGGGVYRTLNVEQVNLKSQLKVVYETPGLAPHPLAAHPRLTKKIQEAVIKSVLKLSTEKEGRAMLSAIKLIKPIRADFQRDYQMLDSMAVEMYQHIFD